MAAASRLFAERGPDAVSIRDVAAAANVNHALVHRHFGSKDELVRVVVEAALERIAAAWPDEPVVDAAGVGAVVAAARKERAAVRVIAWALMTGHPVDEIVRTHPVADRLLEMLRGGPRPSSGGPGVDRPEVAVAALTAMVLGWSVFEPWVDRASGVAGLDDYDPEAAITQVAGVVLESAGWESAVTA
jgi:AcrR family transcriptional regulator